MKLWAASSSLESTKDEMTGWAGGWGRLLVVGVSVELRPEEDRDFLQEKKGRCNKVCNQNIEFTNIAIYMTGKSALNH